MGVTTVVMALVAVAVCPMPVMSIMSIIITVSMSMAIVTRMDREQGGAPIEVGDQNRGKRGLPVLVNPGHESPRTPEVMFDPLNQRPLNLEGLILRGYHASDTVGEVIEVDTALDRGLGLLHDLVHVDLVLNMLLNKLPGLRGR
jgi:hypothetical protein